MRISSWPFSAHTVKLISVQKARMSVGEWALSGSTCRSSPLARRRAFAIQERTQQGLRSDFNKSHLITRAGLFPHFSPCAFDGCCLCLLLSSSLSSPKKSKRQRAGKKKNLSANTSMVKHKRAEIFLKLTRLQREWAHSKGIRGERFQTPVTCNPLLTLVTTAAY